MAEMTPKQQVLEMISRLPDDVTIADILYHVYVLAAVERGEQDIRDGKTITHEEAKRRLARWLT